MNLILIEGMFGSGKSTTTQLLSDEGYAVAKATEEGEETETFVSRDFEKKFFSEKTNRVFCKTFLENALRDPITKEIGKTIIFAVSQNHARKITEILNDFAEQLYPNKYNSDLKIKKRLIQGQIGLTLTELLIVLSILEFKRISLAT